MASIMNIAILLLSFLASANYASVAFRNSKFFSAELLHSRNSVSKFNPQFNQAEITPLQVNNFGDDPCCLPKVWQGIMFSFPSDNKYVYAYTIYSDSTKGNFAFDVAFTIGDWTEKNISIILKADDTKRTGTIYQFEKSIKQCQRSDYANMTFDQLTGRCIPKDATHAGVFTLGIPQGGANLPLDSWMWVPSDELHFERLVTKDCAPAMEILTGNVTGKPILQSSYYFYIQTSISDPSVFDVPDYCSKERQLSDKYSNILYDHLKSNE